MGVFSQLKEGLVFAFEPPAVQELGNATGFDLQLQDRGGPGHDKLIAARNQLLGLAARHSALTKVRPNGLDDAQRSRLSNLLNLYKALGGGLLASTRQPGENADG